MSAQWPGSKRAPFLSSRFPCSCQTRWRAPEAFRPSFRWSDQRCDSTLPSVPQRPSRCSEPSVHGRHHLHLLCRTVTCHHLWGTSGWVSTSDTVKLNYVMRIGWTSFKLLQVDWSKGCLGFQRPFLNHDTKFSFQKSLSARFYSYVLFPVTQVRKQRVWLVCRSWSLPQQCRA